MTWVKAAWADARRLEMTLEFREASSGTEWDHLVSSAPGSSVYHRAAWLEAIAQASGLTVRRIVGYRGDEPVVAFPFGRAKVGPLRAVLSPPPGVAVEFLGPVYCETGNHHGRDSEEPEIIRGLMDHLQSHERPSLVYTRLVPRFTDGRVFRWSGCAVEVLYTHVARLGSEPKDLLQSLDRSVRKDIGRTDDKVSVREGGVDLCRAVRAFVASRYRAQNLSFAPSESYMIRLFETLGRQAFLPIGAYTEEGLEAAAILTFHGDRASYWQGAARPNHSRLPLVDHLIWYGMEEAIRRGFHEFELVGANTPRLEPFKSKFAPDLEPYFEVTKAGTMARLAQSVYRRLRR